MNKRSSGQKSPRPTKKKSVRPESTSVRSSRSSSNGTKPGRLYQFKITLLGIEPTIWRRIQITECSFDKLHEHIQTAMGWTNSHLHLFDIKGKHCGDPELLGEGFEYVDSTRTLLSDLLPEDRTRLAFSYTYDFGDGWEHEVLFEGCPPLDPKAKYPLCLEGERACPPEDCGGVGGYVEFLEALSDEQHEDHEDMLEWISGKFDSEAFDPAAATKRMKKVLPNWRAM